jgi:hypothetical protein
MYRFRVGHHVPVLQLPPCCQNILDANVLSLQFPEWALPRWSIYARLLAKLISVDSKEITKDLFERRSHIYSDKLQSIVYELLRTMNHLLMNFQLRNRATCICRCLSLYPENTLLVPYLKTLL